MCHQFNAVVKAVCLYLIDSISNSNQIMMKSLKINRDGMKVLNRRKLRFCLWICGLAVFLLTSVYIYVCSFGHEKVNIHQNINIEKNENFSSVPFPLLIHQLQKQDAISPSEWRKTITDFNPDSELLVWTEHDMMDLLYQHYPWFLDSFGSYIFLTERENVMRYFILHHHGGVFLAGDMRPVVSFTSIALVESRQSSDCILMAENNGAQQILDTFLMCKKHSMFLSKAITCLDFNHDDSSNLPTLSISQNTGGGFLTTLYSNYERKESLGIISAVESHSYFSPMNR